MKKLQILLMAAAALVAFTACDDDNTKGGGNTTPYVGGNAGLIVGEWSIDKVEMDMDISPELEQMFADAGIDPSEMDEAAKGQKMWFNEDGTLSSGTAPAEGSDEVRYSIDDKTLTITLPEGLADDIDLPLPGMSDMSGLSFNFDIRTLDETSLVVYLDLKPIMEVFVRAMAEETGAPVAMVDELLSQIYRYAVIMSFVRVG
jgi:hypothetical protein